MPKRQSPPPSHVPEESEGDDSEPVAPTTIGGRVALARQRLGWTKAQLARAIGKPWRSLHKWETNEQQPDRKSVVLLAGALGVTVEELLGVAEGQNPPFASWLDFLATPEGASMDDGERRMLQSLAWPPGREPTIAGYLMILAGLRGGSRARN